MTSVSHSLEWQDDIKQQIVHNATEVTVRLEIMILAFSWRC
jgi:hypothetical protein